jgi:hypothetical protein
MNHAILTIKIDKVERIECAGDGDAFEVSKPEAILILLGETFDEDFEDGERLQDGIYDGETGAEKFVPCLVVDSESSAIHAPSRADNLLSLCFEVRESFLRPEQVC